MASWGSRVPVKAHLDRLLAERGHTRPDMCTDQHSWSRCVPAQRLEEILIFVAASHQIGLSGTDTRQEVEKPLREAQWLNELPRWEEVDICLCLPPVRALHKVNDLKRPSRSWESFSLKSPIEHWPSGMNAWQYAEKHLHEEAAYRAPS